MTASPIAIAGLLAVLQPCQSAKAEDATPAALARVRAYEQARTEVIDKVRPAVACLFSAGSRSGGGSGVIIDESGYGLTNFHVVAGMLAQRGGEVGLPSGDDYPMEVLGIDPGGDVAMFRAIGEKRFPAVALGDSDSLAVGDYTLAMGNPFLLAEDYTPTVTLGIISGLHRYQAGAGPGGRALRYTDCIQVATSINPGNSGGPLFDLAGTVVGINGRVSVEERGRVNVGVGYAISINQIKRFMPMLRAGLTTKHATAGFTVADRDGGVIVDQALSSSPAYAAGLRLGDRIVRFGGRGIQSTNQFGSLLGTYPARWPVDLEYQRDGDSDNTTSTHRIRFRLEDLPLPEFSGEGDPYGPHAVTLAANRRAVRRVFRLYARALGGAKAAARLQAMTAVGARLLSDRAGAAPERIELNETRPTPADDPLPSRPAPAEMERAIRWKLLEAAGGSDDVPGPGLDPARQGYAVVDADEIGGRICVVLERKTRGKPSFRVSFDDEGGQLLRIEFEDRPTGTRVRYEYDDYRREGALKFPRVRRLFVDDAPYAEDRFETITVKG
jgi:S1-C subfamily serine protease